MMTGSIYPKLAGLPIQVDDWSLTTHHQPTAGGTERQSTVFSISGGGHVGRGEDVTYGPELHDALVESPPALELAGDWTLEDASAHVSTVDLFPANAPEREEFRHYRQWAVESALLDLALKQADSDLAGAVDADPRPVRFLVSTGLGDPPSAEPVTEWLAIDPSLEFKIDLTRHPGEDVLETLVETGAIRSIDLKAQYAGVPGTTNDDGSTPRWVGDPDPDPAFYRDVIESFPEAVLEDPAVTEATRPLLTAVSDRLAWDAPVHSAAEFDAQPLDVGYGNVKPSRFGTLERLLDFIDFATERGLNLYSGGQYELSVGRGQLHDLASLWYADGPNDIAPKGYNDRGRRTDLASSPLPVPERTPGFGWSAPDESL